MQAQKRKTSGKGAFAGFVGEIKRHKILYLMCIPALLLLLFLSYIPFAGVWMAFTNFKVMDGIFGSEFVGLKHFRTFFASPNAGPVIFNTIFINTCTIILGLVVPVTLAISFNEIKDGLFKRVSQSIMFFPYFLSWVVVGAILYGFLSNDIGVINSMLRQFGMDTVRWYAEPKYWKGILILSNVWKWSGYSSIVYLAAIANFDPSLYEAAEVDGANKLQRIFYLTIPMLKPTAVVLTLLAVGRIFYGDFGMVYGIVGQNSLLSDATSVIDTYVYSSMRLIGFSYGTAVGLFQSVMGLILVSIANFTARKVNDGEGLF